MEKKKDPDFVKAMVNLFSTKNYFSKVDHGLAATKNSSFSLFFLSKDKVFNPSGGFVLFSFLLFQREVEHHLFFLFFG